MVLSALKPELLLPWPTHTPLFFFAFLLQRMPAKKEQGAKGKTDKDLAVKTKAKDGKQMTLNAMSCGFRNLMKYRNSDDCKKAWG